MKHPIEIALEYITKQEFIIIQLGAYIGNSKNDPLFKTISERLKDINGTLIAVEPIKKYYNQLLENYNGIPGVICENVAISDHSGTAEMVTLDIDPAEHKQPSWITQLSSLKESRMKEMWENYEGKIFKKSNEFYLENMTKETVHCITLSELINKHNLKIIDLLQIDVEGYEAEILESIDFDSCSIRFINFESVLMKPKTKKRIYKVMSNNGYITHEFGQDTFCYMKTDKNVFKGVK